MPKAFLQLQLHQEPRHMIGCSTLQHTIVTMELEDPESRQFADVEIFTDQFIDPVIGSAHIESGVCSSFATIVTQINGDDRFGKVAKLWCPAAIEKPSWATIVIFLKTVRFLFSKMRYRRKAGSPTCLLPQ